LWEKLFIRLTALSLQIAQSTIAIFLTPNGLRASWLWIILYATRNLLVVEFMCCVWLLPYILPFFGKLTVLSGLLSARFVAHFTVRQDRDWNVPPINLLYTSFGSRSITMGNDCTRFRRRRISYPLRILQRKWGSMTDRGTFKSIFKIINWRLVLHKKTYNLILWTAGCRIHGVSYWKFSTIIRSSKYMRSLACINLLTPEFSFKF
jgi:hypothetical protein